MLCLFTASSFKQIIVWRKFQTETLLNEGNVSRQFDIARVKILNYNFG